MKTKTRVATQGIAAATLLVLFALSLTAHAATSSTTTTTSTSTEIEETNSQTGDNQTAVQHQSGDNTTSVQEQTGVNESSTENQTGENQTQGDNVSVVEVDQGEQNQIDQAQANDTIAGEVQVNGTSASATTSDARFTIVPTEHTNGALSVQVTGNNVVGPKSFLIDLSSAQDPMTHTLLVTLDGTRVSQASTLEQVLHPSSSAPAYVVVKSATGYQLIVSIPHFSTHVLSIVPLAPGPSQGFFSISGIELLGAAAAITAAFALAFATRKRIYTSKV